MGKEEKMPFTEEDYPKYLAEFIGTYVLVLTIGCNLLDVEKREFVCRFPPKRGGGPSA